MARMTGIADLRESLVIDAIIVPLVFVLFAYLMAERGPRRDALIAALGACGSSARPWAMPGRSDGGLAMKYQVVLEASEEGFAVSVPGLPGCHSQGATKPEALENIADAIRESLAAIRNRIREADVRA